MKGYIYKITNEDESIVYIGSTTRSLKKRWDGHKQSFKKWMDGKCVIKAMIHESFKEHGIDSFKMELISEHEIDKREQLLEFEQKVIDTTECVNKIKAFTGIKAETKQEYDAKYLELYREKRNEQKRRHYHENKERIRESERAYRESINAKKKEKIQCECGSEISRGSRSEHQRTKKHQNWLQSQETQE